MILKKIIEINAKIQPNIEPAETYFVINIAIINTISAASDEGKNIITKGPIPVATPFPPLNLL